MLTNIDHVSICVDNKLNQLSLTHSEYFIHRVYDRLREQNQSAYEPEILAIGPYHYAKPNLQAFQEHKLRYLHFLLRRVNEPSVHRFITAMRALQERARRCYAEPISLNDDEFVEMMLLDSCFIVELLRKFAIANMRDPHDTLFRMDWIHQRIWRDLMLFENQLPFFVLSQFFSMTKDLDPRDNLTYLAIRYHCNIRQYYTRSKSPCPEVFLSASAPISTRDIMHLLDLIHSIACSSFQNGLSNGSKNLKNRWEFINCATELHESGIRFRKASHDTALFDVKFDNGTLVIPAFSVEEKLESLLRNAIAYEQLLPDTSRKCFTDYLTFLFCLVNSSKDVSLLRRYGILNKMLGDDETASVLLTKASTCLFVSRDGFCYSEVFNSINAHCRRRKNIWKAILKRKYFNSPWAITSFLGAIVLLLLALMQTLFSILSYFTSNS